MTEVTVTYLAGEFPLDEGAEEEAKLESARCMDRPATDELTIDQLAQLVGMTVRNLREWRALGLLRAPTMRGRAGYYDESDVTRIERIKQLHAEGFPLELIRRILEGGGDPGDELVRFARSVREPFQTEPPQVVEVSDLARTWGTSDAGNLERAIELKLIRRRDDGRYEYPSPGLVRAGRELMELGLSVEQILDIAARIRSHADAIADTFVGVFLEHVWKPFVDAGQPQDRWAAIRRTAESLRPLAEEAASGTFRMAMDQAITEGIEAAVERLGEGGTEARSGSPGATGDAPASAGAQGADEAGRVP